MKGKRCLLTACSPVCPASRVRQAALLPFTVAIDHERAFGHGINLDWQAYNLAQSECMDWRLFTQIKPARSYLDLCDNNTG
jgi:hypothetical protein